MPTNESFGFIAVTPRAIGDAFMPLEPSPGVVTVSDSASDIFGGASAYAVGFPDPFPWAPPATDRIVIRPPMAIPPGWPTELKPHDPGISISADVGELVLCGMSNVDALRLLMLCGWSLARAQKTRETAKEAGLDPVKLAKKHVRP